MTEKLLAELKKRLIGKTQDQVAKELEISRTYLADILHGRRGIEAIAEKLGFKKVVTYKKSR